MLAREIIMTLTFPLKWIYAVKARMELANSQTSEIIDKHGQACNVNNYWLPFSGLLRVIGARGFFINF